MPVSHTIAESIVWWGMRIKSYSTDKINKKTIFHSLLRRWGMVFLVVLMLPYIISIFVSGDRSPDDLSHEAMNRESRIVVRVKGEAGTSIMTMEEYLYGCLPMVIPVEYEQECLKAQAILLRTRLIDSYKDQLMAGRNFLEEPADSWLSRQQLEEQWGSAYQEKYEKVIQAVSETKGIYITYQGNPIEACYFRVSAGRTRNGTEVLGRELPYLQSVECPKDYLSTDYLTQTDIKKKELEKLIGGSLIATETDAAGYIKNITLKISSQKESSVVSKGDAQMEKKPVENEEDQIRSGEWLREKLMLNSACFSMEEDGKIIRFAVKGVGHGLGMSQFGANEMAMEGKDCNTILTCFFQNITMDKYE